MSIRVENITKTFGKQIALKSVSTNIGAGEVVGFLGPNGAGKSTLMKILTGFIRADQGKVAISGMEVRPEKTDYKKQIGYLPEHNPLYPEMYIREYLEVVAGFYALKNKKKRIEEVVEMTGLQAEIRKKIGALSKGYKQRVGLAQALIHDPEVLILDEPTSGLDPNQLADIRKLITGISADKTVILSTHIMQEVEAICSRVLILNKGQLIADTPTRELHNKLKGTGQSIQVEFKEKVEVKDLLHLDFIDKVERIDGNRLIISAVNQLDIREDLFKLAIEKNWTLLSLSEQNKNLEAIFRELTI